MRTECAEILATAMLASVGDRQMPTPRCAYCNVDCEYAREQK